MQPKPTQPNRVESANEETDQLEESELDEAAGGAMSRSERAQAVASGLDKKVSDTVAGIVGNLK